MKNITLFLSIVLYCAGLRAQNYTEQQLKDSIAKEPTNPKFYNILAMLYYKAQNYEEAISNWKQAALYDPKDARPCNNIAELLKSYKKYDEASEYYRKAIAIDTANSLYSFNLAYMYQHQVKNPDSAMFYYRKSGRVYTGDKVGSNENPWYALLDLSGALYNADYYIEAYEVKNQKWKCYQCFDEEEKYKMLKNLRDNPNADAYIKLGDELTKKLQFNEPWKSYMARFNNGITIYDKALKLDPTKKTAVNSKIAAGLKEIAGSYLEDGYYEDALSYYEKALKYTQKDPEIYSAIGYIKLEKAKTPDYDGAIANFQKALTLTTASMAKKDTYENIGLCYEKKKDYKNAIVWYDKAVATEPNFAKSAHYKLARVYDALGNAEKAKYHRMRS